MKLNINHLIREDKKPCNASGAAMLRRLSQKGYSLYKKPAF
jgi:hypothetical protein